MNIQALKRWHWAVVGMVAGAILAGAKMLAVSDRMVGGPGFMDQARFETGLNGVTFDGTPAISDIVIRPRGNVDILRFRQYDPVIRNSAVYLYAAQRPYVRLGAVKAPSAEYRVADYLAEVAGRNPKISFTYAWWEKPAVMTAIYSLVGAVVVGGAWPVLLRMMGGAGLGRPEPDYDLDRFKSEPVAEKKEMTEEERERLAQLEAEMLAGLAGAAGDVQGPVEGAAGGAAVKTLASEEVAALEAQAAAEKAYAGQFYPVEKKAPHGFTIVELLVVIGIVVMLAALLLPMLSQARERAKTVHCASNLRQVGAGLEMYNQVNRHLPVDGAPGVLARAMEEMNVGGVMACPSDASGGPSYSMNNAFAGMPKSAGNPTDVLGSESGSRHVAGPNILYFDGHVEERLQ